MSTEGVLLVMVFVALVIVGIVVEWRKIRRLRQAEKLRSLTMNPSAFMDAGLDAVQVGYVDTDGTPLTQARREAIEEAWNRYFERTGRDGIHQFASGGDPRDARPRLVPIRQKGDITGVLRMDKEDDQ